MTTFVEIFEKQQKNIEIEIRGMQNCSFLNKIDQNNS